MKICVISSGYIGSVTATRFAEIGNHTICVGGTRLRKKFEVTPLLEN